MKTEHTPAPWRNDSGKIFAQGDYRDPHLDLIATPANGKHADARRIVACVNGCEGLENPLEDVKVLQDRLKRATDGLQSVVDWFTKPCSLTDTHPECLPQIMANAARGTLQAIQAKSS